jgi:hypothetical protein
MKKLLPAFLLIPLTMLFCGCPYDSPYNVDVAPMQNIDESLLGKWATFIKKSGNADYSKEDPVKVIFSKRTDVDYDIAITGYIDELRPYHLIVNDSIKGTGYLSDVAGRQFLNAFIQGKVYIAEIKKENGTISILPLSEYFTSKLIKSSKELRTAIEFHYRVKLTPAYDPLFSLKKLQRVN